ncbi:MAG: DNA recombination protein RmuC [Mariprofundaceae bacterium]
MEWMQTEFLGWIFAGLAGVLIGLLWGSRGRGALREERDALASRLNAMEEDAMTLRTELAAERERRSAHEARNDELQARLTAGEAAAERLRDECDRLRQELARVRAVAEKEREAAAEKLALLDEARAALGREFQVLASKIVEEKGKKIAEEGRRGIGELLTPVREQLRDFRQRIDEIHRAETSERASLRTQIEQLRELNLQMNEEARNLTRALKGDRKAQGDWGELVLETVLEHSGLRKGIEYEVQGGFRDADGRLRRPDVIIHLPPDENRPDRHLIIDSKVSLSAWADCVRAEDEETRKQALARHVRAVREHIDALSGKDYAALTGLNAPDFVFMFMPIEAAFMAAFEADRTLFARAFDRNIIVVTPSTLLATLKTVEQIWRYERQNEHARRIAERAGRLYDKLRGFIEDFEKIGQQIETLRGTFDGARNKLVAGRGNVIRQAEQFVELGVKVRKRLPQSIRDDAGMEEE